MPLRSTEKKFLQENDREQALGLFFFYLSSVLAGYFMYSPVLFATNVTGLLPHEGEDECLCIKNVFFA
jgi:hypothetical protein